MSPKSIQVLIRELLANHLPDDDSDSYIRVKPPWSINDPSPYGPSQRLPDNAALLMLYSKRAVKGR